MGLLSFFKKRRRKTGKRRTNVTSFRDYQNVRPTRRRKPITPKKTSSSSPQKRTRHRSTRHILAWVKLAGALSGVGFLAYGLFFTGLFELQSINIKGDDSTLNEQASVNEYLKDYLGVNLLSFNSSKHEDLLIETYPHLKAIDIQRKFFHGLETTLETYKHIANVQVDQEDGSKQFYVVNEQGHIASIGSLNERLPTIVMDVTGTDLALSEEETSLSLNEELINADKLNELLEAKEDFEAKFDMQILEVHYLKRARELHFYTERYFMVWIDLTQSIDLQLTKLKKSLTELNIYEADLQYIDLRISGQNGEKVLYKLRNTE